MPKFQTENICLGKSVEKYADYSYDRVGVKGGKGEEINDEVWRLLGRFVNPGSVISLSYSRIAKGIKHHRFEGLR